MTKIKKRYFLFLTGYTILTTVIYGTLVNGSVYLMLVYLGGNMVGIVIGYLITVFVEFWISRKKDEFDDE